MTDEAGEGRGVSSERSERSEREQDFREAALEAGAEARIEGEVRRRLTDRLASAGVGTDGVAREVLYLLPQEFVEAYRLVMMRALKLPGGVAGSEGEQVGVDQGRILEHGPTPSRYRGTERGLGMGGGGGKRWKNTGWVIRDERWLEIKVEIDRRLMELARKMKTGKVTRLGVGRDTRIQNQPPGESWMNPPVSLESHGNDPGKAMEKVSVYVTRQSVEDMARMWVDHDREDNEDDRGTPEGTIESREIGRSRRVQRYCTTCGKVMRNEYVRCPYHNA